MNVTPQQTCAELIGLLDRVKRCVLELANDYNGLTRMQVFGLYILDQYPEISMRHMADMLHCDASNVTGIVDRLVAHGFVIREESKQDRRAKTLTVTARGKAIIDKVMADLPARLGCDKLSSNERELLHTAIQKLMMSS